MKVNLTKSELATILNCVSLLMIDYQKPYDGPYKQMERLEKKLSSILKGEKNDRA